MNSRQQLSASRASEKVSRALFELATMNGDLSARLTHVWLEHLSILHGRSLPGDFQEQFDGMYEKVTAHGIEREDEGQIHASIRHMSEEELDELARQVVRFAIDVEIEMAKP